MQQQLSDTGRGRDPEKMPTSAGTGDLHEKNTLNRDEVFEVLYNRRRRDIITYLRENDGRATISDLAEHIAAKENDITVQQLSSSERKRVYVGLYQNHLPMMDDIGVVDYDKDRGTIQLRKCASELEPYLGESTESRTPHRKAGMAVGLAGFLLLGVFDVAGFAAVSDLLWAAFGVAGLFVLAVYDELGPVPY